MRDVGVQMVGRDKFANRDKKKSVLRHPRVHLLRTACACGLPSLVVSFNLEGGHVSYCNGPSRFRQEFFVPQTRRKVQRYFSAVVAQEYYHVRGSREANRVSGGNRQMATILCTTADLFRFEEFPHPCYCRWRHYCL